MITNFNLPYFGTNPEDFGSLAYKPLDLDAGLPIHPSGRKPGQSGYGFPELDGYDALRWFVAWRSMELRIMGRLSRSSFMHIPCLAATKRQPSVDKNKHQYRCYQARTRIAVHLMVTKAQIASFRSTLFTDFGNYLLAKLIQDQEQMRNHDSRNHLPDSFVSISNIIPQFLCGDFFNSIDQRAPSVEKVRRHAMSPSHRGDRIPRLAARLDDPKLVSRRPAPPTPRSSDQFNPLTVIRHRHVLEDIPKPSELAVMPGVRSKRAPVHQPNPGRGAEAPLIDAGSLSDVQTTTSHRVVTGFTEANLEDSRATVQHTSLLELASLKAIRSN